MDQVKSFDSLDIGKSLLVKSVKLCIHGSTSLVIIPHTPKKRSGKQCAERHSKQCEQRKGRIIVKYDCESTDKTERINDQVWYPVQDSAGNIGSIENVKKVVDACKEKHIPIRIGVNSGSLDKSIHDYSTHYTANALVESAKKHVKILEDLDFHDIVISLKGSDVLTTIKAYEIASDTFPYPLHLGITEAGTKEIGIVRSVSGLAPLLLKGIGDTIRISLSADPKEEVIAAKRMLHDLGLYPNYPTLVACPTCGRTRVNVPGVADKVLKMLEEINKPITVAVMGCVVNGPGEAKNADIGIAGGNGEWILFKKGQVIATLKNDDEAIERLKIEINQ